ncbi:PH domain-containing protein [Clostridium botulinum]|uniref:ATP-dependent Clp protease ATP-binding subunit ClpX zinc ribbon domain-containing protein n=1 Tax=Clostridium botulinum TaxID=1491 RepID=A0A6G4EB82_CLOBO|nr:PH domain-containing protein [Clostridium botulinum]APH18878.1 bacterial PH domain protein [Clostridium botulinum]AUM90300.1 hypothetical protein RSJ5_03085 [Clostridium botulinum]KEJ01730.1 hypothetical protein N497_02920 [Clostridium botulinum F 357]MBN3409834.1 hypothetical protein [Clostridium botulinum]MBY6873107.1 PH domain-containing protein [Clostridium botulinum]
MGFFDLKATCSVCLREVGLKRYKIKKSNAWICPECLKRAGGVLAVDISKCTTEDIKGIIAQKEFKGQKKIDTFTNDSLGTAKEMYDYCIHNGFGSGWNEKWGVKHFKIIEDNLMGDEKVYMTFIGMHKSVYSNEDGGYFAYAITNRRIMLSQKSAVAGETFKSVSLENINDITFESGVLFSTITIDTIREILKIELYKGSGKLVNSKIHEVIDAINNNSKHRSLQSNNAVSVADELKKFKELLDMGVLTQEEFNAKKKQLLNI